MNRLTIRRVDALLADINEVAVNTDWSSYGLPLYPRGGDESDVRPRRELRRAVIAWYARINGQARPRRARRERVLVQPGCGHE